METSRWPIVSLVGDLDCFNIGLVRDALAPIHGEAIVDLTGVRLLGAAAMTELVRASKRAGPGQIVLVVSSPHIRGVLDLVEFDRLFRIVARLEDA